MAERLALIREAPSDWVDWWGGLGGGAQAVEAVLPKATRHVLEPTPEWAELSRRALRGPWWSRLGRSGPEQRVRLVQDGLVEPVQLVWANMMLHSSADPASTMLRWHAALRVGGFLMFSTFGPDSLRELREVYAELGWAAPHAGFVDMHDIGDQLVHSGFADPVMDQERLLLTWSSPETLLAELRGLGANLQPGRLPGLRTPRWREALCRALEKRAGPDGRISLGFELVYGHAFKAPPKPGRGEPVTVSLDSVRASLRKAR
jgi:malonyl-CoA O-methyltransferase